MSSAPETRTIGVLGAGRLGKALSLRLRGSAKVVLYDVDARKGKQLTKQNGLTFLYEDELLACSEIVLLCIPGDEVRSFLRRLDRAREHHPLYVNMATDLDTPELIRELGLEGLPVIGLKPIGQFAAIRQGLPTTFVTAHCEESDLAQIREIFRPIGNVVAGDERKVGPFNRKATELALRFCVELNGAVRPLAGGEGWVESALCSLAAGTILDFPPAPDNAYAHPILAEILHARGEGEPPRGPRKESRPARVIEIPGFDDFGGRHCETASLRKLLRHHGFDFSEELLFGLGGGIGFIFWQTKKMPAPFVGGRNGKFPEFILRIGAALGQPIELRQTASERRAQESLIAELAAGHPVVCYGDIYFLPYFQVARHFGGHAFVVFGIDEARDRVSISDRGTSLRTVTLSELRKARSSEVPPFPPQNAWLRLPPHPAPGLSETAVRDAIRFCCDAMTHPPIASFGLPGIRKLGRHLAEVIPAMRSEDLVDHLIELYVDLELAGTGGCAFRKMYRVFLEQAEELLHTSVLPDAIARLDVAIGGWEDLLHHLLPPFGPALRELRETLCSKSYAFENGTMEDLKNASYHLQMLEELRGDAGSEVERHKAELLDVPGCLEEIHRAESALFDILCRI